MSSASSGRYQSRLFNFVHQQSRRLTKQCDRALRQLQFAADGVVTALLSPLYLLFQSPHSVKHQLHRATQPSSPQLPTPETSPTADTPIQQVMFLVEALSSKEATANTSQTKTESSNLLTFFAFWRSKLFPQVKYHLHSSSPASPASHPTLSRVRPVIRAIATHLENRTLILVTEQNEILDILTAQQQQKFQERIIAAVADYWRYQRLTHSIEQQSPTQLPQLFNSQLKQGQQEENLLYAPQHPFVAFLDSIFAQMESNHLAPVSQVVTTSLSFANTLSRRSGQLVEQLKTQFPSKSLALSSNQPQHVNTSNASASNSFKIQTLIWAAIDYFFGTRTQQQFAQSTLATDASQLPTAAERQANSLNERGARVKLFSAPQLPRLQLVDSETDPWLTLSDLFGDSEVADEPKSWYPPESSKSQTTSFVSNQKNLTFPSRQAAKYTLRKLRHLFQTFFLQSQPAAKRVKRQKTSNKRSPSLVNSSQQLINQTTQMEPAPDWIETHATVMGYVKHPLEQLLEWLDRAMLWIEAVLLRVWHWCKQWWQIRSL